MIIKIENGAPVGHPITEENFRQLFPNEVFPLILTNEIVEPFGYAMYDFSNVPEITWSQKLEEVAPTLDDHGIWRQTWKVIEKEGEERDSAFESVKIYKREEIDRYRLHAMNGTFNFKDKTFSSDEISRIAINEVTTYVALNNELPVWITDGWKSDDGTYLPIGDVDEWREFTNALAKAGNKIFQYTQELKARVNSAETFEEIMAVTW